MIYWNSNFVEAPAEIRLGQQHQKLNQEATGDIVFRPPSPNTWKSPGGRSSGGEDLRGGVSPKGKKCKAMEGLIEEGKEVIEKTDEQPCRRRPDRRGPAGRTLRDGRLRPRADIRQAPRADGSRDLLQATLDEEGEADKKLTELAETVINVEASTVSERETLTRRTCSPGTGYALARLRQDGGGDEVGTQEARPTQRQGLLPPTCALNHRPGGSNSRRAAPISETQAEPFSMGTRGVCDVHPAEVWTTVEKTG